MILRDIESYLQAYFNGARKVFFLDLLSQSHYKQNELFYAQQHKIKKEQYFKGASFAHIGKNNF